jgi:Chlamydia CHLPS protein (DUF818)
MTHTINTSMKDMLVGKQAFYNQPDYQFVTRKELDSKNPAKVVYTHTIENKVWRVVKIIFAVIIFPIGLYQLMHCLIGRIVLPASSPALLGLSKDYPVNQRGAVPPLDIDWRVKRISVKVDGYIIDAAIFGKESTFGNGRWLLNSGGNGEFYEQKLQDRSFKRILSGLKSNAIVFNYPGVGSSSGMPSRSAMSKAYRAMLRFLEDEKKGIGAKEIVGYGHSIGGGVQGEVLRTHKLKKDIKYVFVKSRTFSDLSAVPNKFIGFMAKVVGWNMSSVASSKKLKVPEIIMQTANVHQYEDISKTPEKIIHDGVISAEASLARRLLADKKCRTNAQKYFMGIPEGHNDGLCWSNVLVQKIEQMFKLQPITTAA